MLSKMTFWKTWWPTKTMIHRIFFLCWRTSAIQEHFGHHSRNDSEFGPKEDFKVCASSSENKQGRDMPYTQRGPDNWLIRIYNTFLDLFTHRGVHISWRGTKPARRWIICRLTLPASRRSWQFTLHARRSTNWLNQHYQELRSKITYMLLIVDKFWNKNDLNMIISNYN